MIISSLASAATITLNISNTVIQDAYTNWQTPNGVNFNWGNSSIINIQTIYDGFIRFNLSSLPSNITILSANLSLDANGGFNTTVNVWNTSLYNSTGAGPWEEGNLSGANCGSNCLITQNLTWNTQPDKGVFQSKYYAKSTNASTFGWRGAYWYDFNVTNAVISAYANSGVNHSVSFRLNWSDGSGAVSFWSKQGGGANVGPQLDIVYTPTTATCGACGLSEDGQSCNYPNISGSYCNPNDNSSIITTSHDCTINSYYTCPTGSYCGQITPQANITTPLVQETIECNQCYFWSQFGSDSKWHILKTNCPNNPECNNCNMPTATLGAYSFCWGNTLYAPNITSVPANASDYVAGCYNGAGIVVAVIRADSSLTNLTQYTNEVFNTTTYNYNYTCPSNTSTSCFSPTTCLPAPCPYTPSSGQQTSTSWVGIFAVSFGSLFGITNLAVSLWFFILFMIGTVCMLACFFARDTDALPMLIIFGALCFLLAFTLAGWLPSWIMIILIVIAAYIVAQIMGIGK